MVGAFLSVASTNFQRAARVGRSERLRAPPKCVRPIGRCGAHSCEHFLDDRPVGEAEDVVEVLLRVLGIAAGVRPAEHGDGPASAEKIAQRVGELGRLGECADEQHIEIGGELVEKILPPV